MTRPQTQPGVVERWRRDLADAVEYAQHHRDEPARSGAIYGGAPEGPSEDVDDVVRFFMADLMDHQTALPAP